MLEEKVNTKCGNTQHERRKRGRSTRNAGNESDQPGNSGKKTLRRGRWFLKMAHGVALFSRPKSSQRKYISRQHDICRRIFDIIETQLRMFKIIYQI